MDECVCACVFVMILTNEQIVITVLWHVTMSYPYYDSHVRYYNQHGRTLFS